MQRSQLSVADRALADKAKASGTAYQSRDEAVKQFQQKHSNQYTSRYASEPAARPTYIPKSTYVDNRQYNVYYDRRYGGYGYLDYGGHWRYYDAMTDAIILSSLMNRHSYYYPPQQTQVVVMPLQNGEQPVVVQTQPVVREGGGWGLGVFFGILIGIGILLVIGFIASKD